MASFNPPKKNVAYRMFVGLRSQADTRLFQVNPTLASGDAKVSKDGGALANVATLPTVIGSSAVVQIDLSSTEMNADNVTIVLSDAAGGQWCDLVIGLQTAANQFDDLALASALATVNAYVDELETRLTAARAGYLDNLSGGPVATAADVNAQVLDVLTVDTFAELSGVPAATASLKDKIGWLFMLARNKRLTTGTSDKVRNDGDSGDVATATVSDDGTTFTRGEWS